MDVRTCTTYVRPEANMKPFEAHNVRGCRYHALQFKPSSPASHEAPPRYLQDPGPPWL